ncbi:hypothetical protein D3C71_1149260 [compost metagenome]
MKAATSGMFGTSVCGLRWVRLMFVPLFGIASSASAQVANLQEEMHVLRVQLEVKRGCRMSSGTDIPSVTSLVRFDAVFDAVEDADLGTSPISPAITDGARPEWLDLECNPGVSFLVELDAPSLDKKVRQSFPGKSHTSLAATDEHEATASNRGAHALGQPHRYMLPSTKRDLQQFSPTLVTLVL